MSDFNTPEFRRQHGLKLLHLVEQADAPIRALCNHLAVLRTPETEHHFDLHREALLVRSSIEALTEELQFMDQLARELIDNPLPDIEPSDSWMPGDPQPDPNHPNTTNPEWELPF